MIDCFSSFTEYETLEGDNAWYNEETDKKIPVKKRITFWSLPKILIITFKRFSFDGKKKRQDLVDYPLTDLNLSKFVSGYNAKQYVYDLYGVCNHSGNTQGGHYTAFVKTGGCQVFLFHITSSALQGCPLSGSVFAMCADPFSRALSSRIDDMGRGLTRACADDIGVLIFPFAHRHDPHRCR